MPSGGRRRKLLWRPGHLIGNYISGHRQICYKPVNMLFIVALAYVILMQIIGQDDNFNADAIADYDRTGYFEMINFCYQCYQWLVAHPGWAMMILTTPSLCSVLPRGVRTSPFPKTSSFRFS